MGAERGYCHRCGEPIETAGRVGRRDTCRKCGSDLHCCLNCRFYEPGRHNDCRETQAERQVEKAAGNFCEYFELRGEPPGSGHEDTASEARRRAEALFKKKG